MHTLSHAGRGLVKAISFPIRIFASGLVIAFASPAAISASRRAVVLPLTFGQNGLSYIPAAIGDHTIRLNIDLGASAALTLTREDLDRAATHGHASLRPSESRRRMNVRGDVIESRVFETAHLRLAGQQMEPVVGYEEANAPGYAPPEHVGLIGHAFLRRYRLVFDYPSSRLTLIDPKAGRWPRECRRPQTMTIPFQYRDGVTVTALLDANLSVRLILDTGASVSALKHSVIPETSAAGPFESHETRIAGQDIGGVRFQRADLPGLPADGLLGVDVFQASVICIDFDALRLRITPASAQKTYSAQQ
jgi:hypothetical protein